MPNEQREFWSKVARSYDRVVDQQIGLKTRVLLRQRLDKEDALGTDVVEFGCGTGFYTQVLAAKAERLVATDLSPGMLAVAKERVNAHNVTFQMEDCQKTSFPPAAFDAAFLSLVLHFTEPDKTLVEMHRILRTGGVLIIANLDLRALTGVARIRSLVRILYRGLSGYRVKPPKGFGRNVVTEKQLCDLLRQSSFRVLASETFTDDSRSSNVPIGYVCAEKV